MAWKPLGNVFSAAFNQVNLMAILTKFSKKYNCSVDVLLLAWLLKHPTKVIPVIGTTSIARVINQKTSKDIKMNLKKKTDFFHYADKTSKISRSYLKTKK
jgi:predicted oxidoreductase